MSNQTEYEKYNRNYLVSTVVFKTNLSLAQSAAILLSEDGENPEYDRAISELVTDQAALPMSDAPVVLEVLREWRDRR